MSIITFGLSILALLPAIFLCFYIYIKDRVEKEPISLLLILLGSGIVAYIPTLYIVKAVCNGFDKLFETNITHSLTGVTIYDGIFSQISHGFLCSFIGVALIEELVKWLILFFITRRNKHFDCLFDGIVYSTFISLGFSVVESFRYAIVDGWDTVILRSLTTIPAHLLFGIIMGLIYTLWHTLKIAKEKEIALFNSKDISEIKIKYTGILLAVSLIIPIILHGLYRSIELNHNSSTLMIIYYVLVAILYIICFALVFKFSKYDIKNETLTDIIIMKKHKDVSKETIERI